jgi:DNA polymerase V
MKIVDQINRRFPKAISLAATGFDKSWKPKADRISPRYTTDWRELVYVKCKGPVSRD